jgi:hypothetical protein
LSLLEDFLMQEIEVKGHCCWLLFEVFEGRAARDVQ